MKATIELPDSLLQAVKELAAREKTTLRALVESGLRAVLKQHQQRSGFKLRDVSFQGRGLQPEFQAAGWDRIQQAVYEGRGA